MTSEQIKKIINSYCYVEILSTKAEDRLSRNVVAVLRVGGIELAAKEIIAAYIKTEGKP